jgi:hypothetical protein
LALQQRDFLDLSERRNAMKLNQIVCAIAAFLVHSATLAGDLRVAVGVPIASAVYSSSNLHIWGGYAPAHHYRHGRYPDNNAYPIDPYRGQRFYAAPIVIYNQLPAIVVFSQPDPLNELRALCAPNVSRVCSGSTCVFCN